MGTAIGVDVRDDGFEAVHLEPVFDWFRAVDERFSPYKPDSEVSRLIRGEIDEAHVSRDLADVLGMSEAIRRLTSGYFDVRRHRADGRPDPTGMVKGWSVERGAAMLDEAGASSFTINAGGDVVARGEPEPGQPWRVGIRHPRVADKVAAVLGVRDLAVATSGAYERGEHIVDPHTGMAPDGLLSLTVVGPSLAYADAFATAGFAMGRDGIAWVVGQPGYGAYAITTDDRAIWTPLVERLLV